ncbi:unnamed protein product, partial [Meganyctiphanes norvegica]
MDWSRPLDNPCHITNYTVTWANISGGTEKDTVVEPPYNITGLSACTNYTITIIAYTKKGQGVTSEAVTLTSGMDVPGKIPNVTRVSATSYSLEVDWSRPLDNSCHITNYTVICANSSGEMEQDTVTETLYNITGLAACTNYIITIIANTYVGSGEPSDSVNLTTLTDVPGKSTNVTDKS